MRKIENEALGRLNADDFRKSEKLDACLVLDNIRSALNVGSVFRTGDSFRVETIYLCGITAQPPHREIHKTALGAQETVEWTYREHTLSAVEELKAAGYIVTAVEQTDESTCLSTFMPDSRKKYAFVFGNEVYGVSDEIVTYADQALEIPQYGTKHSLNIAVSAGVILWDFLAKKKQWHNV